MTKSLSSFATVFKGNFDVKNCFINLIRNLEIFVDHSPNQKFSFCPGSFKVFSPKL